MVTEARIRRTKRAILEAHFKANTAKAVAFHDINTKAKYFQNLSDLRSFRKQQKMLFERGAKHRSQVSLLRAIHSWTWFTDSRFEMKRRRKEASLTRIGYAMKRFKALVEEKRARVKHKHGIATLQFKHQRRLKRRVMEAFASYAVTSSRVNSLSHQCQRNDLRRVFKHWFTRAGFWKEKRRSMMFAKEYFELKSKRKYLLRYAYFSLRISAGLQVSE